MTNLSIWLSRENLVKYSLDTRAVQWMITCNWDYFQHYTFLINTTSVDKQVATIMIRVKEGFNRDPRWISCPHSPARGRIPPMQLSIAQQILLWSRPLQTRPPYCPGAWKHTWACTIHGMMMYLGKHVVYQLCLLICYFLLQKRSPWNYRHLHQPMRRKPRGDKLKLSHAHSCQHHHNEIHCKGSKISHT